MVMVFADRFGLYVHSRVTVSRMTESDSGGTPGVDPLSGQQVVYSVEGTRNGIAAYAGPGLLLRLTSRTNLDLGVTLGGAYWGEPDTGLGPEQNPSGWLRGPKDFFVVGMWVGLVIGIG